jgi:hypothetical protein
MQFLDLCSGISAATVAWQPISTRVRALTVLLQGVLGAWAVFLLLRGTP